MHHFLPLRTSSKIISLILDASSSVNSLLSPNNSESLERIICGKANDVILTGAFSQKKLAISKSSGFKSNVKSATRVPNIGCLLCGGDPVVISVTLMAFFRR
ncbi:hypothetical protein DPMN_135988 [Dreissena polymorpha]|uniref:Uncharacterized protein n=1 Tax=Dreissena polymorpha TaxID=45954 RepID=A0A9D4FZ06_DREPO|nr:hypothetical protein DPMN_135988 [Dreissena polymorpha]